MIENDITARRLKACRERSGETLEQIGQLVGVNKTTVMRWERGDTWKINIPTLQFLADHFHVSLQWLLGDSTTLSVADGDPWQQHGISYEHSVLLPILGSVRAGVGEALQEEVIGHEAVNPDTLQNGEKYFWLRVSGDSMTPYIDDGDLVLIRQQKAVESGQYAAVLVDGGEGLVKKVLYGSSYIELQSINPYYPPRRFENENAAAVRVLGVVVESRRKFL